MQVVVPPTFCFPEQAETVEQRIEIDSNDGSFVKSKSSLSFCSGGIIAREPRPFPRRKFHFFPLFHPLSPLC